MPFGVLQGLNFEIRIHREWGVHYGGFFASEKLTQSDEECAYRRRKEYCRILLKAKEAWK